MSQIFSPAVFYPTGTFPYAITTADFNGDNNIDLAITSTSTGDIAILLGNGDGTFQGPSFYPSGNNPTGIVAADFNGDGHIDLATSNANGG